MIKSNTVFVLGAGASKEVGLPVGSELKATIADKLDIRFSHYNGMEGRGDLQIYESLQTKYRNQINEYLKACWRIRDGIVLSDSIDDFIHANDDEKIATCAKLAIERCILEAEKKSALYFKYNGTGSTINFNAIQNTWYRGFYSLLTKELQRSNIQDIFKNITIVNFNYDRCLEHYLTYAIAQNYGIDVSESHRLIQSLKILRPYGIVRPYNPSDQNNLMSFGSENRRSVEDTVSSLRTYTEQIQDKNVLDEIQSAISQAETVIFLGCAFHLRNMDLLGKGDGQRQKQFFATRKGISDAEIPVIQGRILCLENGRRSIPAGRSINNVHLAQDCNGLFTQYQRLLIS